jgi:hypothetical protein
MTFSKQVTRSAFISAVLFACSSGVQAADTDPKVLLKRMTEYITSQTSISASIDTDIEVVTPDLQKIQFTSSSKLQLSRPDKLRVERKGGYADVDLVFDGTALWVNDKQAKAYAHIDSPGTTDQLIERLRSEYSVDAPGADLLLGNAFEVLTDDVMDAKYIGEGVIGGVECDHVAVRDRETDWQIWIERGEKPIPRKYVITSKAVTGAPQYTLVVREWNAGTAASPEAFVFKAPTNAQKITIKDLSNFDEVPAGTIAGEHQ